MSYTTGMELDLDNGNYIVTFELEFDIDSDCFGRDQIMTENAKVLSIHDYAGKPCKQFEQFKVGCWYEASCEGQEMYDAAMKAAEQHMEGLADDY